MGKMTWDACLCFISMLKYVILVACAIKDKELLSNNERID